MTANASAKRPILNFTGATVLPFAVVILMTFLEREFEEAVPWYGTVAPLWVAIAAGFVFIARQWRSYAIALALPYLAVMYLPLHLCALTFVGGVYHDYL